MNKTIKVAVFTVTLAGIVWFFSTHGRNADADGKAPLAKTQRIEDIKPDVPKAEVKIVPNAKTGSVSSSDAASQFLTNPLLKTDDRAYLRTVEASLVATIDAGYEAFFKKLKLDPVRARHLREALAARQNVELTIRTVMAEESASDLGAADYQAISNMVYQDAERKLQTLMTEAEYEALKEYHKYMDVRDLVEPIQKRLDYLGEPVSEAQGTQLLEAYAVLKKNTSSLARPFPNANAQQHEQYLQYWSLEQERLLASAQKFLSAQQLSNLRDYLDEQLRPIHLAADRAKNRN